MVNTIVSSVLRHMVAILLLIAVPALRGQTAAWPPDDNQLKTYLMGEFTAFEGYDSTITGRLRDGGVTDEQLRHVLTSIYAESETAFAQAKDKHERMISELRRRNALRELGRCADNTTKAFLLGLAADTSKDGILRIVALSAYLRAADAEEAKEALLHFLVTPNRIDNDMDRSEIYTFAYTAWQESSPRKKLAICEALQVGLAHEPTHWVFCSGDGWLSAMSAAYARSKERLALLARMYATSVPDGYFFDKQSLVPQLDAARKLTTHTSVNTNLMTAMARDFNQPLPEEERIAFETPPDAPGTAQTAEKPPRTGQLGRYALGGATAAILAAAGVWVIRRRRGASRP